MKEKTKDVIVISIIVIVVFAVIGGLGWELYNNANQKYQDDKFCEYLFLSPLEKDNLGKDHLGRKVAWGELNDIEEGYIRCCRRYAENHEIKEECEIFHEGNLGVGQ